MSNENENEKPRENTEVELLYVPTTGEAKVRVSAPTPQETSALLEIYMYALINDWSDFIVRQTSKLMEKNMEMYSSMSKQDISEEKKRKNSQENIYR